MVFHQGDRTNFGGYERGFGRTPDPSEYTDPDEVPVCRGHWVGYLVPRCGAPHGGIALKGKSDPLKCCANQEICLSGVCSTAKNLLRIAGVSHSLT